MRLSVIIVTYNSADDVKVGLPALLSELDPNDEIIIVDNCSTDSTVEAVHQLTSRAQVISNRDNTGFAEGCNIGAARATGDILLFLNPDAVVQPGFGEAIRAPIHNGSGWDAWQGLVLDADGKLVNSAGNIVHFTGIGWAGQAGTSSTSLQISDQEVPYLSGACLAVRRHIWEQIGGFPSDFFMYQEDLDLSFRIRLAGGRIGIVPDAFVQHDYVFIKGDNKWRLLERNRWSVLLRCYPGVLLLALAPALLLTEIALLAVAWRGGWLSAKLWANGEVITGLWRLKQERKAVQSASRITPKQFARWLTPTLTSQYFGPIASWPPLSWGLKAYWRVVRQVI